MKPPVFPPPALSLLALALAGAVELPAARAQTTLGIKVLEANGTPVEGAAVCFGTASDIAAFGQSTTDQVGGASVYNGRLPPGETTIYFTATKRGRGARVVQQVTHPAPPFIGAQLYLPAAPGGPDCPGDGAPPGAVPDARSGRPHDANVLTKKHEQP